MSESISLFIALLAVGYGIFTITSKSKSTSTSTPLFHIHVDRSTTQASHRLPGKKDLYNLEQLLRTPKSLFTITTIVVAFIALPPIDSFSVATSGLVLFWSWARQQEVATSETLLDLWPTILQEMSIRTASTGSSIARTFFSSTHSFPSKLQRLFDQAESIWALTNDLETAFRYLERELPDSNSQNVLRSILRCELNGGHRSHEYLEQLHVEQRRRYDAAKDLETRLASVGIARYFVIVVPLVMFGLGSLLSGNIGPFTNSLSQLIFGLAILILTMSWVWITQLMTPPQMSYSLKSSLSKTQRLALQIAVKTEKTGGK